MDPLADAEPLVSYKNKVPVPSTSQPKNLRIYSLHKGQYFKQTTRQQTGHNQPTHRHSNILCRHGLEQITVYSQKANFRHDEHHGLQSSRNLRTQINTDLCFTTAKFEELE